MLYTINTHFACVHLKYFTSSGSHVPPIKYHTSLYFRRLIAFSSSTRITYSPREMRTLFPRFVGKNDRIRRQPVFIGLVIGQVPPIPTTHGCIYICYIILYHTINRPYSTIYWKSHTQCVGTYNSDKNIIVSPVPQHRRSRRRREIRCTFTG